MWANWSLREPSEFDAFYEEWLRWFPDEAPVGQGTLLPLSHRRAGFRVSLGVIAAARVAPGDTPREPAVIPVVADSQGERYPAPVVAAAPSAAPGSAASEAALDSRSASV